MRLNCVHTPNKNRWDSPQDEWKHQIEFGRITDESLALIHHHHRFDSTFQWKINWIFSDQREMGNLIFQMSRRRDSPHTIGVVCSKIPFLDGRSSLFSRTKLINWKAVNVPRSLSEASWWCHPKRIWRICFYLPDDPRMTLSLNCREKFLNVVINYASMSPQRSRQLVSVCHFVVDAQSSFQLMRHKSCLFFFSFLSRSHRAPRLRTHTHQVVSHTKSRITCFMWFIQNGCCVIAQLKINVLH